jgi:DNA polymerase III subunit delta'
MQPPVTFSSFLGNAPVVRIVRQALARNRLPHALIFAGPSGVGKRRLALLIAQRINCLSPAGQDTCGACRSCLKIINGNHPDVREIRPEGTVIRIEQTRALINEVAFEPFEAGCRFAILDSADQMRNETANSLLKTLEEPPSRTYFILITSNPYALLPTIRSRCRMLQFGGLSQQEIEEYLISIQKFDREEARLAASFSNGSLGTALSFDSQHYRKVRKQALAFVQLLLNDSSNFTEASRLSAVEYKDKDGFQLWMESVMALLEDVYFAQVAPHRMAQPDIADELNQLAASVSRARIVSAIEAFKTLKKELVHNVNRQIALESLYLSRRG